jgi:hypothetical protein
MARRDEGELFQTMRGVIIAFLLSLLHLSAVSTPKGDEWLTNAPALPGEFAGTPVDTNLFATLRTEVIAGRLRITWDSAAEAADARLILSADEPGHWPARDWRSFSLKRRGASWQAEVPVDSLDVPLVYFVISRNRAQAVASPMRIARPGTLGLEQPSRIFWPFIEGFEQGTEGWRTVQGGTLRTDEDAKHGGSALKIQVPPNERSVTLLTTRVRGWFLQEHRATGLALWLKTRRGTGTAAFELMADAFTTNQVLARRSKIIRVPSQWTKWTKVELPFSSFPKFPIGELDLIAIELTGLPGTEFLLDDVELLGPWRSDF